LEQLLNARDRVALQWGHGDEAVEEAAALAEDLAEFFASMGPRR